MGSLGHEVVKVSDIMTQLNDMLEPKVEGHYTLDDLIRPDKVGGTIERREEKRREEVISLCVRYTVRCLVRPDKVGGATGETRKGTGGRQPIAHHVVL